MKTKPLSWLPRRKGDIYCAPACGGGCTYLKYVQAKQAAADLAKEMGPGWKPLVWENLGWHYSIVRRWTKIHPFIWKGEVDSYTAFIGDDEDGGGKFTGSGKTAREALNNALKEARTYRNYLIEVLYQAEAAAR